jgi:hypothetical protein
MMRGEMAAMKPFAVSRKKTTAPQVGPRRRKAFVAPIFLLPPSCRSEPSARPIQRPDGIEPRRKPRITETGSI